MLQSVIREACAHPLEGVMPAAQRAQEIFKAEDLGVAALLELSCPVVEAFGIVDPQGFVRTKCRIDAEAEVRLSRFVGDRQDRPWDRPWCKLL